MRTRTKRSVFFVLLVMLSVLALAACGGGAVEEPVVEDVVVEEAPAKIAAVLTGPWDDNSWNEAAYDALQVMEEAGYEIGFSESVFDADAERVLRQYADEGYDMIVGHSFGYADAAFALSEEYPDVNFAWAGGINRTAPNVADYDQPFYEISYPIGIIAGYMSETGQLGSLSGFDIPVCHAMGEAFLAGALTVNPDATLAVAAVGDWIDVAKAKEAALAQADTGVDFWIECGEGPALGAIEAAKEVDGYVVGYVGDMSENGPDVVPVSLVWNMVPLFEAFMSDTLDGSFSDDPWYAMGVAEDVLQMAFNENIDIPAEAIEAANQAIADIKSGDLVVPFVME
jgi:basic membrane protein A and related proteins